MKKLQSLKPIVDEKSKIIRYGDDRKNENTEKDEECKREEEIYGT